MRIFGFSKFSSLEITITISKSCFPKAFSAELPNYQGHPIGNRNISFLRKLVAILLLNQRRAIFMKSRKLGFFHFARSSFVNQPIHLVFFNCSKEIFISFVLEMLVHFTSASLVFSLNNNIVHEQFCSFIHKKIDKTAIELREFKLLIKDYFFSAVKSFKQERTFPSNNIHQFILR